MNDIWGNAAIWIPIIIWFLVQGFKVVYELVKYKKLNIRRMWGSGGMPSSHSALVCSLTTIVALIDGISSTAFAISIKFLKRIFWARERTKNLLPPVKSVCILS